MKLIGFIKEHNNIIEAQKYSSINITSIISQVDINLIIDYLNNGELVFGWMGYFMDIDNGDLISPDSYYTDGIYIWPAYLPYYLKKGLNYLINQEFLYHVSNNNYKIDKTLINSDVKLNMETFLSEKFKNH